MEYRVEALAEAAGIRVDTVRFYQRRGLLPGPERRGRIAIYGDAHLRRLRRIRELLDQGFRLAQIDQLLVGSDQPETKRNPKAASSDALLRELVSERVGHRSLSRAELARESGVPEALLRALQAAGLMEPVEIDGEDRFGEADLEMARASLEILGTGFPLDELLSLAMTHARHVSEVTDRAIDLFDAHVRSGGPTAGDGPAISEAFKSLLPHVTRLVALHFQRTLVNRALERLEQSGEDSELATAVASAESASLEIAWRS